MSTADANVNIVGSSSDIYEVMSHYQNAGPTGHFQLMGLAFDEGGTTWSTATETKGFPVRMATSTPLGLLIQDIHGGITHDSSSGITSMLVDIASSAGLTINAIVEDLVVGITTDEGFNAVGVYGTGSTAVGVTGSVYTLGTTDVISTSGVGVFGPSGGTSAVHVTGTVSTTGTTDVTSTAGITVHGQTGAGTAVHVVGKVEMGTAVTDSTSFIGITGSPFVSVTISDGLTSGKVSGSSLQTGLSFDAQGLSSGVRLLAFSTGSTTDYIYVGGSTSVGVTTTGFPLREMDSVFIETSNMRTVCVAATNSNADLRFIGS